MAAPASAPSTRAILSGDNNLYALALDDKNYHTLVAKFKGDFVQDVNQEFTANRVTALHIAAESNSLRIGKLLIEKGAKINAKDASGNTPLHRACFLGHKKFAELLLKFGCEKDVVDMYGKTALGKATFSGHQDIVQLLLDNGFSKEIKDIHGQSVHDIAVRHGQDHLKESLGHDATGGYKENIPQGIIQAESEDGLQKSSGKSKGKKKRKKKKKKEPEIFDQKVDKQAFDEKQAKKDKKKKKKKKNKNGGETMLICTIM